MPPSGSVLVREDSLYDFNHAGWRGKDLFIDLALLTCRERRSADAARDEADR